jgi:hypothetical protein
MTFDEYRLLLGVVPDVPELLIDSCSEASSNTRDEITIKLRFSMLASLLSKRLHYPSAILPPRDKLFYALQMRPDDAVIHVTPQQVQYIAQLAEFVQKNPLAVIKAAHHRLSNKHLSDLTFLGYSTIPAFFGFFSSSEHLAAAFQFYYSLVGTSDHALVRFLLLPFYRSGCTYRYIEMVFDRFGMPFCYDFRLDQKEPQRPVLEGYISSLIDSIHYAFPLLPHPHKFLLRFMLSRGWSKVSVIDFFVNDFTMPHLLKYVKALPFPSHYLQLKELCHLIKSRAKEFLSLFQCIELDSSFETFEVPSAFTVFNVSFIQLLLTASDIHTMLTSLRQVNEIPASIRPFVENQYLNKIELRPIWIRVYSRIPKAVESSYNWRNLVFPGSLIEVPNNKDFERMWGDLKNKNENFGCDLIQFLRGEGLQFVDIVSQRSLKAIMGARYDSFLDYAIMQCTRDLQIRSRVFERYLVDSLSLQSLLSWHNIVDAYYSNTVRPIAQKSVHMMMRAPKRVIDLDQSLFAVGPGIRRFCFMIVIRHLLPEIIPQHCVQMFAALDARWKTHMHGIRSTLQSPLLFLARENRQTSPRLNKELWAAIGRLKLLDHVKFEWVVATVLGALGPLDKLAKSADSESSVIQYAVAFSDCVSLLSRFMTVNIFVMKHKAFRAIEKTEADLLLWSRFENAILRLLERDPDFAAEYVNVMDEITEYSPAIGPRPMLDES